jgi:hypothetical protein
MACVMPEFGGCAEQLTFLTKHRAKAVLLVVQV